MPRVWWATSTAYWLQKPTAPTTYICFIFSRWHALRAIFALQIGLQMIVLEKRHCQNSFFPLASSSILISQTSRLPTAPAVLSAYVKYNSKGTALMNSAIHFNAIRQHLLYAFRYKKHKQNADTFGFWCTVVTSSAATFSTVMVYAI